MTLADIRQEVYGTFGLGPTPEPEVVNRIDSSINSVYMELMGRKGTARLRRSVLTFASVANSPFAVMPQVISRYVAIADRTNNRILDEISLQELRRRDPGLTFTAPPDAYVDMGKAVALAKLPSAAAELFLKSTSASDTTGITVYVDGVRTGGYPKRVEVTLNGTTAVSLGATITDWIDVTRITLSGKAAGTITLHQTSGAGTELASIAVGRTSSRYSRIQLHATPDDAYTYHADVELALLPLQVPTDEPLLPDLYQWLLSSGAIMREWLRREKIEVYREERARFMAGRAEFISEIARPTGFPPSSGGYSQLGSYYPAGT